MNLKVGDIVTIRSDLNFGDIIGNVRVNAVMPDFKGKNYMVASLHSHHVVYLKNSNKRPIPFRWHQNMLEFVK